MFTSVNILALLIAYLLGSVASAVWIGQLFYGVDVREYGSGNAGASNAFRILGKKAGAAVLFIDALKGWLAVNIAYMMNWAGLVHFLPGTVEFIDMQLALGIAALIGHIFPLYVGFRGGKGVATLLGIIIAIHPVAAFVSSCIFIITLIITRYVSLGSIIASLSFPLVIILIFHSTKSSLTLFSLLIPVLVLITHQKNIKRLLKKEESKANIYKRGRPDENNLKNPDESESVN